MKKLILTILILTSFKYITGQSTLPNTGDPALPVVYDLSYDVSTKTYYKVQEGISWEDINPLELVGLYPRESFQQVQLKMDQASNPVRIEKLYSQKDMMPKWYEHREFTMYGVDGITSKIYANQTSPNDSYHPYDSSEQQMMIEFRQNIIEEGYLHGLIYQPPTGDQWESFSSLADQVTVSDDGMVTSLFIDSRTETWDNSNLRKISEGPMEEGGRIRVTHYYLEDDEYGLNLLQAVIVERFMTLLNGICVTEVNIEYYSNYEMEPINQDIDAGLRSSSIETKPQFTLYPNPMRGDILSLELTPNLINVPLVVRVTDISGRSLHAVQLSFNSGKETIHLSGDQYTDGLYFMVIESANSTSTQPFFITK